jgi:hypothetical protein
MPVTPQQRLEADRTIGAALSPPAPTDHGASPQRRLRVAAKAASGKPANRPAPRRRGGRIAAVNHDEIRAFANRDWPLVAAAKRRYWSERKRSLSPADSLRIADDLRRHMQLIRPDWPSPSERAEDLETHARVSASLRRVP